MGVDALSAIFAPVLTGRRHEPPAKGRRSEEPSPQAQLEAARIAVVLCKKQRSTRLVYPFL